MNCTVCGNPLLFDRVAFNCSCGAFVHAYCWDEHVLQAHRPSFEIGAVNLDGEFVPRESRVEVAVPVGQVLEAAVAEEGATEEQVSDVSLPAAQDVEQQIPEEQTSEDQAPEEESSDEKTTPLSE